MKNFFKSFRRAIDQLLIPILYQREWEIAQVIASNGKQKS